MCRASCVVSRLLCVVSVFLLFAVCCMLCVVCCLSAVVCLLCVGCLNRKATPTNEVSKDAKYSDMNRFAVESVWALGPKA